MATLDDHSPSDESDLLIGPELVGYFFKWTDPQEFLLVRRRFYHLLSAEPHLPVFKLGGQHAARRSVLEAELKRRESRASSRGRRHERFSDLVRRAEDVDDPQAGTVTIAVAVADAMETAGENGFAWVPAAKISARGRG